MAEQALTGGAIRKIVVHNQPSEPSFAPILQVLGIRNISSSAGAQKRFKGAFSDGTNYHGGLFASQLNTMIENGELRDYCLIRLQHFMVNTVKTKRVIMVLNLEVVAPGPGQEIGHTTPINPADDEKKAIQGGGQGGSAPAQSAPCGQQAQAAAAPAFQQNSGGGGFQQNQYNRQPQQQQQQQSYGQSPARGGGYNSMPRQSGGMSSRITPVAAINPYQPNWTIKVRCTVKGQVRHWKNANGEGSVFSIDLLDQDGTEIRCTMFKEGVDKFQDVFQEGSVYLISKGRVKVANKKWTHIKNDYEITLDTNSTVEIVNDEGTIQHAMFDFFPIGQLDQKEENSYADILGIVKQVFPIGSVMSKKTQQEIVKRNIMLADQSGGVELTLWGETAEKYDEEFLKDFPVIAIKAARVSGYNGRSLSASQSSTLDVNPELQEAYNLKAWWTTGGGAQAEVRSLTNSGGGMGRGIGPDDEIIEISAIKDRGIGQRQDDKPDYIVVKGVITSIRNDMTRPPYYIACKNMREGRQCNKKVDDSRAPEYFCEACNSNVESEPRFILSFAVNDYTGQQYLNCFNDIAEDLLGFSASQLSEVVKAGDQKAFEQMFSTRQFQQKLFKVRAKAENYQDEMRVKCTATFVEEPDWANESRKLINLINGM
eukprot:252850_1